MSAVFALLFLCNFLQIFAFLALWSWILLITCRLLTFLLLKHAPGCGRPVAASLSLLVTISLVFHLLYLLSGNGFTDERTGLSTPWFSISSLAPKPSPSYNWFGHLWRLNPFFVVIQLLGELLVAVSKLCGRSASNYVAGVFDETSWIFGLISLLLCFSVFSVCLLAAMRYQVQIGLRGVTLSRQWLSSSSLPSGDLKKLLYKDD